MAGPESSIPARGILLASALGPGIRTAPERVVDLVVGSTGGDACDRGRLVGVLRVIIREIIGALGHLSFTGSPEKTAPWKK